jgi:hypothetical protein
VTGWLLDANVLSELRRLRPDAKVIQFVSGESVRKEDIEAFAYRDWRAVTAPKRRRWAEQKSRRTPAEAFERWAERLPHRIGEFSLWDVADLPKAWIDRS